MRRSWWSWLTSLLSRAPAPRAGETFDQQEARAIADFSRHFHIAFRDTDLLRLALTHRSYLSVTGMGPRESNERLEFLGDSVLGLVTSEYLYRRYPDEHEGQLTKTKSLLVSKAILSRRALSMGLGRFVLMSHSEVESGGRQRLSILADAFESVIGAIYLDQGFEQAREFIEYWLLRDSREIVADKRHRNYKSHLQEFVQTTFRTHPVYRIRSQMGPDHSKLFLVEVMVGRRVLGEGRGTNKKEAEQAAARDALEKTERPAALRDEERALREPRPPRESREPRGDTRAASPAPATPGAEEPERDERGSRRGRGRRGRGRDRGGAGVVAATGATPPKAREPVVERPVFPQELEPPPSAYDEDDFEEVGRPEGPLEERHVDPFGIGLPEEPAPEPRAEEAWTEPPATEAWETAAAEPEPDWEEEAIERELPGDDEASVEPEPEPRIPPPGPGQAAEGPRFGRRRPRRR